MRRTFPASLALVLALAACADDDKDAMTTPSLDAGISPAMPENPAPVGSPAVDAGAAALKACIERPGELPRPPSRELPCELLPPGFSR